MWRARIADFNIYNTQSGADGPVKARGHGGGGGYCTHNYPRAEYGFSPSARVYTVHAVRPSIGGLNESAKPTRSGAVRYAHGV